MARKIKKETIMGILIVFLMVSSIFGIVLSQNLNSPKKKVGNYVYKIDDNNRFVTKIEGKNVFFYNDPEYFNKSIIPENFINIIKNTKMIYYTQDINDTYSQNIYSLGYDISSQLFSTNQVYIQPGLTSNESDFFIRCENATQSIPVIYIKESNETKIDFKNNCLTLGIESNYDLINFRDELLYKYYGLK